MGLPYQEAEAECEEAGAVPRVTWVVQCLLKVRRLLVCLCSVCWVQVPFLFPPCAKPWAHESGVKGCGV